MLITNDTNGPTKQEETHRLRKRTYRQGRWIAGEFGVDRETLLDVNPHVNLPRGVKYRGADRHAPPSRDDTRGSNTSPQIAPLPSSRICGLEG